MPVSALSSTNIERPIGGEWILSVLVTDADCDAVDAVPVVTVTLPAGTTATPTVETLSTGVYRAVYALGTAGRYIARVVAAGYGAADFVAFVTATTAATAMPTLIDLRGDPEVEGDLGYLGPNSFTDAAIQDALDAEAAAQRRVCNVPAAYPDDLRQALLRRVARNLSMRKLTLALARGDAEAGSSDIVLGGNDPEVRRFERPHRKLVMG